MRLRIPSVPARALGALVLVGALFTAYTVPTSAAPSPAAVVETGSVSLASSVGGDGPSHHFGFRQASVLAQATAATITKSDAPDPVAAGGTLTFSIPVTNVTNVAVTNVQVTDTLPGGLTLTATPTSTIGTCTGAAGTSTFTCNLDGLAAGQTATITATALVPTTTANGTILTNTATLTFIGPGNVSQTVTATSTTTVTAAVAGALTLTKTGSPTTLTVGGPLGTNSLTYTITVSNPAAGAAAQNVVVTDTLPANVAFLSANSSLGTCTGSSGVTTVTCTVGTLSAGQSATITIVVTPTPATCQPTGFSTGFPGGFPGGLSGTQSTTLTNTASVTATGVTAPGPATATTTVNCLPFPPGAFPPFPLLPPPPLEFLPPPPPPLLPPPPGFMQQPTMAMPAFPEVPVIPEADTVFLLVGGLVVFGAAAGLRTLRRRKE